ncbi:BON domain-containing protein [Primorskyibacter sp. 2E107]|uniref:BON domain-containing protein n=1 Tax=Primorskyibacter sp. 2E107 TaxID=3403458 RepID=UPI003AF5A278
MRDFLAIVAIVLVVIGLGVFRVPGEDALVAAGIRAEAAAVVYQARHPLQVAVSGRVVTVTGRVESAAEAQAVVTALGAVQGVSRVVSELTVLPEVAPFGFRIARDDEGGALVAAGHVPDVRARGEIAAALGQEAVDLIVARGVPDDAWGAVAVRLAEVAANLGDAQISLEGRAASVQGVVDFPADRAAVLRRLADVPEGYKVASEIAVRDDGTPYRFVFSRDPVMGVQYAAKLPEGATLSAMGDPGIVSASQVQIAGAAMDEGQFAAALAVVLPELGALPQGMVSVTPGVVAISGGPLSDAAVARIGALAEALPQGWVLQAQVWPEDTGGPLGMEAAWDGARLRLSGRVPLDFWGGPEAGTDAAAVIAARIGRAIAVEDATQRTRAPDLSGWAKPAWRGLAALVLLREGHLRHGPEGLTLDGLADDPAVRQRVRAALGGAGTADIRMADDGAPAVFTLSYDAATGAAVSGKLPAGLSLTAMAGALGLETLRGDPDVALQGTSEVVVSALEALGAVLPVVETATLRFDQGVLTLDIGVTPGVDPAAVPFAGGARLRAAEAPLPGTQRVHVLTGEAQVFQDGYWFPRVRNMATAEACTEAMADLGPVPFEDRRVTLRYDAALALARLAAVARICTWTGALQLRVEARADGMGYAVLDRQLARRRAETIRQALVVRGIDARRIAAVGAEGPEAIRYSWQ